MNLAQRVSDDFEKAYYAEAEGNLAEALRLYRLIRPYFASRKAIEKDGMRIELGTIDTKIDELRQRVAELSGAGKLKRVNLTYQRPDCDVNDCYCR